MGEMTNACEIEVIAKIENKIKKRKKNRIMCFISRVTGTSRSTLASAICIKLRLFKWRNKQRNQSNSHSNDNNKWSLKTRQHTHTHKTAQPTWTQFDSLVSQIHHVPICCYEAKPFFFTFGKFKTKTNEQKIISFSFCAKNAFANKNNARKCFRNVYVLTKIQ